MEEQNYAEKKCYGETLT